ncbi:hypothetical protein AB0D08_21975 [Kitasatospora sp. NPDC048540]|uniref:hypothetical protein n=1 Tax=Kitasatospora sp. NPDC048540 TaxID=3155634 RepID=UPI0033E8E202
MTTGVPESTRVRSDWGNPQPRNRSKGTCSQWTWLARLDTNWCGAAARSKEARFRYFGTEGVFEQLDSVSRWQDKKGTHDVTAHLHSARTLTPDDPARAHVAPELRIGVRHGPWE